MQGYFVHEDDHWVGVSMQKRRKLFQATWYLLSQHVVLIGDVDRLVGKFGFVHSCRPVMRSVFVEAYGWIEWHRSRRLRSATLPDVVWLELMVAALLLPYAHFDLSASYSQRVECTDALHGPPCLSKWCRRWLSSVIIQACIPICTCHMA